MSCWPMKNLGSRSPKYFRNRCSAGESIKWNQSRRSIHTDDYNNNINWNVWFKRNKKIITKLSMLASEPINEMGALLYSLTLQNYNSILYPKSSGWNSQNVPFSCLDACDNYLHIFNLDGNLRDPRHPRSLVLLLEYIKSVLNDDVDLSARFPLDTILSTDRTSSVRSAVKYHELYPYFQKKTYFIYSRRLGRLLDPDTDKMQIANEMRIRKQSQSLEQGQKTWKATAEEHRRTHIQRNYEVQRRSPSEISPHQYTLNATNRIDGTSLPSGSMRTLYPSNHTLVDEKGRRFGHGSRQLIDLRTKRAEIMRLLISKMHKGDPDRLLKGLKAFELKETSHGKRKKTKFATEHLDSFYTDTVTTESKKKTPFYVSRDGNATQSAAPIKDAARIQPMYKGKDREPDRVGHKERRYFADPLPVLFHAPYNEKMESTWLRRDPHQLRLQEDGHVAAAGAKRYKRQSVQQSIARAEKNYSIHSLNSVSSHEIDTSKPDVLKKKPEYRRVFSSQSRRFKKKSS